jgi:hypothetical protein
MNSCITKVSFYISQCLVVLRLKLFEFRTGRKKRTTRRRSVAIRESWEQISDALITWHLISFFRQLVWCICPDKWSIAVPTAPSTGPGNWKLGIAFLALNKIEGAWQLPTCLSHYISIHAMRVVLCKQSVWSGHGPCRHIYGPYGTDLDGSNSKKINPSHC